MNKYVFGDVSTTWIPVFTGGLWGGGDNDQNLEDLITLHGQLLNRSIPAAIEISKQLVAVVGVSFLLVHCATARIETLLRLSMIGTLWCGEPSLGYCCMIVSDKRMLAAADSCGLKYTIDNR